MLKNNSEVVVVWRGRQIVFISGGAEVVSDLSLLVYESLLVSVTVSQ